MSVVAIETEVDSTADSLVAPARFTIPVPELGRAGVERHPVHGDPEFAQLKYFNPVPFLGLCVHVEHIILHADGVGVVPVRQTSCLVIGDSVRTDDPLVAGDAYREPVLQ